MKTNFHNIIKVLLVLGFLFGHSMTVLGQEEFELSNYRIRFTFSTAKDIDNNRQLEVIYMATNKKDRKDRIPISAAPIQFFHKTKDTTLLIAKALTDNSGKAVITIPQTMTLSQDDEGYYNFIALFEKTASLKKQKKSLEVKDLILDLNLINRDSSQFVSLSASTKDSIGTTEPVEELDVVFSIGGMLSKMPIEDASLEDGSYEFQMPDDIPGDINGDFQLYAFIDDHDDYGTVTQVVESNWGVFDDIKEPEKNKLWTEAAPIWMYVVLTLLLVGVWANFIYTISKLRKIKKLGRIV
ncbi:hypothetical protein [Lutimonas sp.]|uniref:hypothetical protein n=1 Tax=Lutimonas sp. TaxID=1872403 RepID=UPI003D9B24E3